MSDDWLAIYKVFTGNVNITAHFCQLQSIQIQFMVAAHMSRLEGLYRNISLSQCLKYRP